MEVKMRSGDRYETKNFGELEIVEYISAKKVKFRFLKTGFEGFSESSQIRKGQVKDYFDPSVLNVGFLGARKYKSTSKEYTLWFRMLRSCYYPPELSRNKSYIGCQVSEVFRNLDNFGDWCNNQIGFARDGFVLDKDLLSGGDKIYSPENCLFIPYEINTAIANMTGENCGCAGVSVTSYGAYQVGLSGNYIGVYKNLDEARGVYVKVKKERVRFLADKWKDKIDPRAHEALMNFQVFI